MLWGKMERRKIEAKLRLARNEFILSQGLVAIVMC